MELTVDGLAWSPAAQAARPCILPTEVIYGAEGVTEVVQNVRTILTTRKGTVPLDRDFGLAFTFLDSPVNATMEIIKQEVFQAIRKYEPRAKVKQISFKNDPMIGKIYPTVTVEVDI